MRTVPATRIDRPTVRNCKGQLCELRAIGGQVHVIQRDAPRDAPAAPDPTRILTPTSRRTHDAGEGDRCSDKCTLVVSAAEGKLRILGVSDEPLVILKRQVCELREVGGQVHVI
jgi:hypothetical protein